MAVYSQSDDSSTAKGAAGEPYPVAAQCVNTLTPRWSTKLAGFDVYIWDQCYSMEQTLRIE